MPPLRLDSLAFSTRMAAHSIRSVLAGTADSRGTAVGGYRELTRQARCQARLLQPHQMVKLLEALAAGVAAVTASTAGALVSHNQHWYLRRSSMRTMPKAFEDTRPLVAEVTIQPAQGTQHCDI